MASLFPLTPYTALRSHSCVALSSVTAKALLWYHTFRPLSMYNFTVGGVQLHRRGCSVSTDGTGMRTKSWTGKVKNGKKIYGRRKRKGNQTIWKIRPYHMGDGGVGISDIQNTVISVNPASIRVWYKQLLDKAEEKDMKTQKPLPSSEISEQTADDLKEKIHSFLRML